MEYLTPRHRQMAEVKLAELRRDLSGPRHEILQQLGSSVPLQNIARFGMECMQDDLPTAACVWRYMVERAEDTNMRAAAWDKLFQVLICIGPWSEALESAQSMQKEISKTEPDERDEELHLCLLHQASINLGTAYRLLKDFHQAEEHYTKALESAVKLQSFDKEALSKVCLAQCLLDVGQLKLAMEQYFSPLHPRKTEMSPSTRVLFLQHYGNACRSAADWGPAKDYLREALGLAKELKDAGLVSNCCGDLGNVFRSEGRFRDAEILHRRHHRISFRRGDIHGLAVSCGNIGFLMFYNPEEYDDSIVYQAIEYTLAGQVGDLARQGIACNKIGKLYTTIGHHKNAVSLFQIAIEGAKKVGNVAGEGMAWGNLGTVYRSLGRFDDAAQCHINYRDNAERRLDIGGVAIMQHQLALDYIFIGDLASAEESILASFATLEKIRSQLGEEDQSKISNYEKNQSEALNALQVILAAQGKHKEAFVLSDMSRSRALVDIVRKRLPGEYQERLTPSIELQFVDEAFSRIVNITQDLKTMLVSYSVVKEFMHQGSKDTWVYIWVLTPSGQLSFRKEKLEADLQTQVEINEGFVINLRRCLDSSPNIMQVIESMEAKRTTEVFRDAKAIEKESEIIDSIGNLEEVLFGAKRTSVEDIMLMLPLREEKEIGCVDEKARSTQNDKQAPNPDESQENSLSSVEDDNQVQKLVEEGDRDCNESEGLVAHTRIETGESDVQDSCEEHFKAEQTQQQRVRVRKESTMMLLVDSDRYAVVPTAEDVKDEEETSKSGRNQLLSHEATAAEVLEVQHTQDMKQGTMHPNDSDSDRHPVIPTPEVVKGDDKTSNSGRDQLFSHATITAEVLEVQHTLAMKQGTMHPTDDSVRHPVIPTREVVKGDEESSEPGRNQLLSPEATASEVLEVQHAQDMKQGTMHLNDSNNDRHPVIPTPEVVKGDEESSEPGRNQSFLHEAITAEVLEVQHAQDMKQGTMHPNDSDNDRHPVFPTPEVVKGDEESSEPGRNQLFSHAAIAAEDLEVQYIQHMKLNTMHPNAPLENHATVDEGMPGLTVTLQDEGNGMESTLEEELHVLKEEQTTLNAHRKEQTETESPEPEEMGTETVLKETETSEGQAVGNFEKRVEGSEHRTKKSKHPPHVELVESELQGTQEELIQAREEGSSTTETASVTDNDPIAKEGSDNVEGSRKQADMTDEENHASEVQDDMPENKTASSDPSKDPWQPMLHQLYKVLIQPIREQLDNEAENVPRVTFIPQDFLFKVPFAALRSSEMGAYLVEPFTISTSPSIHLLELYSSRAKSCDELSLLAIGNPMIPTELDELPPLPAAADEVRMINSTLRCPQSEVLTWTDANKRHVMSRMPHYRVLHFATHAFVDEAASHGDFLMRGLVVLAKSDWNCNGLLTAEEVRNMDLSAELVVLSCCNSGLGKVTGDGVLGLSRAFLAAGAACVVVTLWKIEDTVTSRLMRVFYEEYRVTRDAPVSMRTAMRRMESDEETRSPEHWAPFTIVGASGTHRE